MRSQRDPFCHESATNESEVHKRCPRCPGRHLPTWHVGTCMKETNWLWSSLHTKHPPKALPGRHLGSIWGPWAPRCSWHSVPRAGGLWNAFLGACARVGFYCLCPDPTLTCPWDGRILPCDALLAVEPAMHSVFVEHSTLLTTLPQRLQLWAFSPFCLLFVCRPPKQCYCLSRSSPIMDRAAPGDLSPRWLRWHLGPAHVRRASARVPWSRLQQTGA